MELSVFFPPFACPFTSPILFKTTMALFLNLYGQIQKEKTGQAYSPKFIYRWNTLLLLVLLLWYKIRGWQEEEPEEAYSEEIRRREIRNTVFGWAGPVAEKQCYR